MLDPCGGADLRTAEGPAGAGGHVDAQAQALRFARRVPEHFHPARRQEIEVRALAAARAVDGRDLDAADARGRQGFELRA